jgi:outer membrane protein assembly factor BamB
MHTPLLCRSLRPLLALPLVAAFAAGCGGGAAASAFSPTFPDSDAGRVTALSRRLESAPPREAPGVIVGTTNDAGHRLFAWDVTTGRALWAVPTAARGVPLVAGRLVLTDEDGRVVARSLRDGREV